MLHSTGRCGVETPAEPVPSEKKGVEHYSARKKNPFFFVDKVLEESKGKANPELVNEILKERLKKCKS